MSATQNQATGVGMPPISVVITVRNEASNIARVVDGLMAQRYAPAEIIIVDGVSTDGTLEILERFETQGHIHLISQPCNIAQGRNIGISRACQDHIAVTDAGCEIDPDWLRELGNCFATNPGIDVVAGNYKFDIQTPFEEAVVLATIRTARLAIRHATSPPAGRSLSRRQPGER